MRTFAFFLRHPPLAYAIAVIAAVVGVGAVKLAPIAAYPSVARPAINVRCTYPGANAREVMNTVAGPLEEQVNGVEGMDSMSGTCSDSGSYTLTVKFKVGYDRDLALMKVQAKVQQALSLLPQEVKNTGVTVESGSTEELGLLTLRSRTGKLTREQLLDYAYGIVNPAILRVPGVGKSTIQDNKLAMRIWLDSKRMASFGINTEEVVTAIKQQNVQASLGTLGANPSGDPDCKVIALISKGRLDDAEDFARIVVRAGSGGSLVRLGDIARIELGQQGYGYSALYDEVPAVFIQIYQHPGVDVVGSIRDIKEQLRSVESVLPEDLAWELSYDPSHYILGSLGNYAAVFAGAILLSLLAVWWLLGTWRGVAAVSLTLVPTLLAAFAALIGMGYFVNVLTAAAFVLSVPLAVGLAATTVARIRRKGAEPAVTELTPSLVAFAALVALAVVPLSLIDGVPGVLCRQFTSVIGAVAVAAAAFSLVLTPVLARLFGCGEPIAASERRPCAGLKVGVGFFALLAVALGFAAWGLSDRMSREFIPEEDMGYLIVDCKTAEGGSLTHTSEVMKRVYRKVRDLGGIRNAVTVLGQSIIFSSTENNAKMYLFLGDRKARNGVSLRDMSARVREAVSDIPEAEVFVIRPPTVPGFGSQNGISVLVESLEDNDPVAFAIEAQRIMRELAASPLAEYVSCGTKADSPHLRVTVDRDKCQLMNVPMSTLYTTLQHYLGSVYVNDINLGTQVNRVTVMGDWDGRSRQESLGSLFVRSSNGDMVPVSALADFSEELGVSACYRWNTYLYCTMQFIPKAGVSESDALEEIRRLCAAKLPRGYRQGWAGLTYEQFKSRGDTPLLLALAALAVLLVLTVRYESVVRALGAFAPSTAGFFGAVLLHIVVGLPFSLIASYALILLSIVFVAGAMLCESDSSWRDRTALAVLAGVAMMPLLFVSGPGSALAMSIAVAVIGGSVGYALFAAILCEKSLKV